MDHSRPQHLCGNWARQRGMVWQHVHTVQFTTGIHKNTLQGCGKGSTIDHALNQEVGGHGINWHAKIKNKITDISAKVLKPSLVRNKLPTNPVFKEDDATTDKYRNRAEFLIKKPTVTMNILTQRRANYQK